MFLQFIYISFINLGAIYPCTNCTETINFAHIKYKCVSSVIKFPNDRVREIYGIYDGGSS